MDTMLRIDATTAERLLDGSIAADDAPPAYRGVAAAVSVLTTNGTESELAGDELLALMTATVRERFGDLEAAHGPSRGGRLVRCSSACLVGAMTLFGGLAAANALPGAAQSV